MGFEVEDFLGERVGRMMVGFMGKMKKQKVIHGPHATPSRHAPPPLPLRLHAGTTYWALPDAEDQRFNAAAHSGLHHTSPNRYSRARGDGEPRRARGGGSGQRPVRASPTPTAALGCRGAGLGSDPAEVLPPPPPHLPGGAPYDGAQAANGSAYPAEHASLNGTSGEAAWAMENGAAAAEMAEPMVPEQLYEDAVASVE
ncbi:unnamed protein product [Triticum aestivum]|uniref:Uncharacterized protein n=1 Tax=Triticum aestivum TaxID=4565 RepID=A0A7H4LJZ8_WHEAT|nr:unnamed protein product [Triticum aestivum]